MWIRFPAEQRVGVQDKSNSAILDAEMLRFAAPEQLMVGADALGTAR